MKGGIHACAEACRRRSSRRTRTGPEQRTGWCRTPHLRNQAADHRGCLDFRADYGPYVFNCNHTSYQRWYWNDDYEYTALRQKATGLCLTLRNGQLTMKPCSAADDAAMWQIDETEPRLIRNRVSRKCLARTPNDRVSTATCTGGDSQRWTTTY